MQLLNILGPVMIGPSSSHTAGAARIGRMARRLLDDEPVRADILLHGSFAKTYQGHGTDRAVIGGLLDMSVDDQNLRNALQIAREKGLDYTFTPTELKDAHPNTIRLHLWGKQGSEITVQAASIGGGEIRVETINGLEAGFRGKQHTLVIFHTDVPGVIAEVSRVLGQKNLNIATMRVFRESVGGRAVMALEMDDEIYPHTLEALRGVHGVKRAISLEKV